MKCFYPTALPQLLTESINTKKPLWVFVESRTFDSAAPFLAMTQRRENALRREPRELSSNAECVPRQGRTDFKILFLLSRTQTTGIFQILPGFEIGLQYARTRRTLTRLRNTKRGTSHKLAFNLSVRKGEKSYMFLNTRVGFNSWA